MGCEVGKREKYGPKWQKIMSGVPYLRNHASYDRHLWYACVKLQYLQMFGFIFSKFWFSGLWGGKRAKSGLKSQKICLSHSILQETCIIWSWFLVHMCKMITSTVAFFIFPKFWFFGMLGRQKGKKWSRIKTTKMTHHYRFQFFMLYISGAEDHVIEIFGTQM